jgi:hypothetical protein
MYYLVLITENVSISCLAICREVTPQKDIHVWTGHRNPYFHPAVLFNLHWEIQSV